MTYQPPPERDPRDFLPSRYPLLQFPEAQWQDFLGHCAALEIPDAEQHRSTLEALYSHLVGVNSWLNLTRLTTPADYLKFQILDSLSALKTIAPMLEDGDTVVDLGSGGGYPGLPLMTWLTRQEFVLVDARQKKVDFLNAAIPLIPRSAKAIAVSARGREIGRVRQDLEHHASLVICRAVGRGAELLEDAAALLATGGVFVLMKGPAWVADERDDFERACPAYGFEPADDVTFSLVPGDPEHHLILAVKTGRGNPHAIRKISAKLRLR